MKMSLVWMAFWGFLWLQASAAQLTEDCLVAVSNGTDGTSVILDCGAGTSEGYEALLRDQYLSPFIRPPSALVTHNTTTTNKSSFAIFLPLSNAQGVLELTYDETCGWARNLTVINVDCRVISVHKVKETYFTACLDSNEELAIYQLYINITNLNVAYAQRSVSVASGNSFSNIVDATLQDDRVILHQLFVVIGYNIHQISPLDYGQKRLTERLPSNSCHTLEYAGQWVLLATCTESGEIYSVYYDINDKRVLNTTQGTDTVLFLCPSFEGRLTVNNTEGVVRYHNWSSNADTEFILRGNVHSGVCFGDSKMASLSFAYSNDEAGVHAINISHGADNDVQLSYNACLKQNCQAVFTLDKYLVVQESEHDGTVVTQVRDPTRNYFIEFEVNLSVAGIALINHPRVENNDTHNFTTNDTHNATDNDPLNATKIAVPVVISVIIIAIAVSSIPIVLRLCKGNGGQYNVEEKELDSISSRNTQEDRSREEPCPNDGQRSDATGGSHTSLTTESDEAMPPIDCTQPHDNIQGNLTEELEEQNTNTSTSTSTSTVDPVQESRQPAIYNPARSPGDGAEENYHSYRDPQD